MRIKVTSRIRIRIRIRINVMRIRKAQKAWVSNIFPLRDIPRSTNANKKKPQNDEEMA
jgi:hypothetical protein